MCVCVCVSTVGNWALSVTAQSTVGKWAVALSVVGKWAVALSVITLQVGSSTVCDNTASGQ